MYARLKMKAEMRDVYDVDVDVGVGVGSEERGRGLTKGGLYGGALNCMKSDAPVCAAKLQMWMCGGVPSAIKKKE